MISVIISSADKRNLEAVTNNIRVTAGVPIEIIAIDNSNGSKGVCQVYNEGAQKAQFSLLCFTHEDVFIRTEGWGKKVVKYFNATEDLGLLGLVGSSYKSSVLSGWSPYGCVARVDYGTIIQYHKYSDRPVHYYYQNPNNEKLTEVAVVDGVWFCTKKAIINEFHFDQETFKRFHSYDIDISLSIGMKYTVAVVYDIILEHYSEGMFEREWADETIKLHKKWKDHLPVNKANFNREQLIYSEKTAFRTVLTELIRWEYSLKDAIRILQYSCIRKIGYLYIKLFILTVNRYIRQRVFGKQGLSQ